MLSLCGYCPKKKKYCSTYTNNLINIVLSSETICLKQKKINSFNRSIFDRLLCDTEK